MAEVLAPAVRLAEAGFPVAPITAYFWQRGAEAQLRTALNGREMTLNGRGPKAGELFRNPNLAKTFKKVAEGGRQGFYEGEIAEAIAATVQQAGGCMTVDDLAAHCSTWEKPVSTTYQGLRLWECPPNGQGITALMALNLLEGFDLPADLGSELKALLGRLNICSKESVVRRYDHEVQAGTVIKPLVGVANDGPSDAAVFRPLFDSFEGVVVSHGPISLPAEPT